jgi:hypothetical protein
MATITYRKLDATGDPLFGNGQNNFVSDLEAVAQAIGTRLALYEGEWWEDLSTGTPLFQKILGQGAAPLDQQTSALLLKQRISGSPYVLSVTNVQYVYNRATRGSSYVAYVLTQFGTLQVTFTPPGAAAATLT